MNTFVTICALSLALVVPSLPAAAGPHPGASPRCSGHAGGTAPRSFSRRPKPGTKARCPVMGRVFTVTATSKWSKYRGRYYVFCCNSCKPRFDANRARYGKP